MIGTSLFAGFVFRGMCCAYEIVRAALRSRNPPSPASESQPEISDVGSFEEIRFAIKVEKHMGSIVAVFSLVSAAVIVALSIIVSRVEDDWYHLPSGLKTRAFTEPAAVVFLFLLFGVSGLVHSFAFVALPDRFGKLRDTVAASICLLVVFLVISLALLPDPIFRSLEMVAR